MYSALSTSPLAWYGAANSGPGRNGVLCAALGTPAWTTRVPSPSPRSLASTLDLQQRAGEVVGVERAQVLERLADPDQLHRHAELLRDCERDPALGGPVELGEHDAVDVDRVTEHHRLAEAVLA